MARPVYQYKPNNDTPDIAIGVLLPLNKGAAKRSIGSDYASASGTGLGVFESSYTTRDAVLSNGERHMQPNFGTNIKSVLFENNTSTIRDILVDSIDEDIKYWLPYVDFRETEVIPSADRHSITVRLNFFITTIGINLVINILASENEFTVTEINEDTVLTEVDSFGSDTAFNLGVGGTY